MDTRLRGGLLTLAAALAAGGVQAQVPALPEGVTPAMVAQGKKLFEGRGMCTTCHGPQARGAVGPNLTDAEWWHSDGTYPAIVQQILHGVPPAASRSGTPMPPKGGSSLSEAEVRAVAAYVHSLRTVANAGAGTDATGPAAASAAGSGHQHRAGAQAAPQPGMGMMMGMGTGMGMGGCAPAGGRGARAGPPAAGECRADSTAPRGSRAECPHAGGGDCPRRGAGSGGNGPCRI